jgi:hypothetical protein
MSLNRLSSQSQDQIRGSTSSSGTKPTTTNTIITKSTKKSRPKDSNYHQKLIDSGVYPYGYEFPDGHEPPLPPEWDKIKQRLAQPRPSLSLSRFPNDDYQKFIRADKRAFNEDVVKDTVLPTMLRVIGASSSAQKNILFSNIDPITGGIAQAKPDYYYGVQPE